MGFLSKLKADKADSASSSHHDTHLEFDDGNTIDGPVKFLTWRSFVMGLCVSMGGFIFGYSTGQVSGFTSMTDFKVNFAQQHADGTYYFTNVRNGLIVGLLSIGTMIGALVAAPIADRIGRKYSMTFWSLMNMVGIIVQIASHKGNWVQVAMGRWVMGLGVGALTSICPMYQSESAPKQVRGAMISSFQLFCAFGILISDIVNFGTERMLTSTGSWRITMGIGFAWPLVLGIGCFFLPESPRFDFRHGKEDVALQTMCKLYGLPANHRVIRTEMNEMRISLEREQAAGQAAWYEIFTAPAMLSRTLIGMSLQAIQQLTGCNFLFYYGTSIFAGIGISNPFVTPIILGAVNFVMTLPGLWVADHVGRRKALIVGGVWMFICFLIWSSIGHELLEVNINNKPAGTAAIIFTCFFICGFATTWGPMIWAICGEMYPDRYRATCMGLSTASNWLWNFLISFFTPFISSAIDYEYGYVFACCSLLGAAIVFFFVMESRGRTLEEVDAMYVLGIRPWQSADWVMPDREKENHSDSSAPAGVLEEEKA